MRKSHSPRIGCQPRRVCLICALCIKRFVVVSVLEISLVAISLVVVIAFRFGQATVIKAKSTAVTTHNNSELWLSVPRTLCQERRYNGRLSLETGIPAAKTAMRTPVQVVHPTSDLRGDVF